MAMCDAFAYLDADGKIDPACVSATEIGVMVNVIFTGTYGNVVPRDDWSYENIRTAYLNVTGGAGLVVPVVISLKTT